MSRQVMQQHEDPSTVRLIEPHPRSAVSDAETFVVTLLAAQSELPYREVVSRLAELLYRNELRAGGWSVDIGLFGSSLFVPEARRALEAGKGELWNFD
jgi:hypothetical protein